MRAAFFDLDKTVIARASIVAFGGPLRRRGLVNRRTVARAVLGQLLYLWFGADEQKMMKIRESMLEVAAGWDRNEVRSIVEETLTETIEPLIYAEAQSLIAAHRAQGDRIWLVSSAPEEIVEPLAAMLGVDGAIASRAAIDDEGRYTGKIEFYAQGEGKATAIRALADSHHLDLEGSSAYSDSVTDLPMLEAVGHPVAVNPDRALAREAKERGWEIVTFSNPVRLRDRAAVRLPVLGGAAVVVALVLAGLGHHRRPAVSGAS
ncbi:MAG TPA: HAD-IB family hydrolase [Acidimicrobiales bacterium]|jgi:HAD superfamily hydrolase (TIGR01490 family)|nr:HAD-IB family hydrolase [Acidimicrobiales bacterium]